MKVNKLYRLLKEQIGQWDKGIVIGKSINKRNGELEVDIDIGYGTTTVYFSNLRDKNSKKFIKVVRIGDKVSFHATTNSNGLSFYDEIKPINEIPSITTKPKVDIE